MFFKLLFKNGEAATCLLGKVGSLEYEGVFVLTYIFQ